MRVLVTGAGALLGQGIIRSLRASAPGAFLIAVDPSPLSAGLYWADSRHLVPMADDPAYVPRMREVIERESPDAVLVGTDLELGVLAAHRESFERDLGTHVVVSSPEVVSIADDKVATYEFLRDNGFPHPRTCLPADVEALIEEVGYPLVVKPRVGARSVGLALVHDRGQLERALEASSEGLCVQEAVATLADEYTAGTITFDGRCRASIVMRRDLRDGNTYRAFVEDFPELNRRARELAEALGAHGPANLQFRLDGGEAKVFEINARFSGTTPLRRHAGFDEVRMCLAHVVEGLPVQQPPLTPLVLLRHWSETVVGPDELVGGP